MAFAYYASITVDKTKVPNTDQTNFPILVSGTYDGTSGLPNLKTTGNSGHVQNANGYDIYFYSDSALTTRLPAERESYNASTGAVIFWVKKTVTTASNTVIYIAYGDSSISTDPNSDGTYGATSVWDSNYKGVWHFGTSSTLVLTDSTSNGFTLTNTNTVTAIAGKINGGAGKFNGTNQYLTNASLSITNGSSITISFWLNQATGEIQSGPPVTIGQNDDPNAILARPLSNKTFYWDYGNRTAGQGEVTADYTSYLDAWTYVVVGYNSSNNLHAIYFNGAVANSDTNSNTPTNTQTGIWMGAWVPAGQYEKASLDEFRVSASFRSADWTATEYNNQNSPSTFYTMGSETSIGISNRLFGYFQAVNRASTY